MDSLDPWPCGKARISLSPENLLPMPAADLVHTMRALHNQAHGLS